MNLKKIKYYIFIVTLSLSLPMLAYSENRGINDKNSFKIAANKKKKTVSVKKVQGLTGSWQSPDGTFTIVFLPGNQLEFNGEKESYVLVPGAIQTVDDGEKINHKYTIKGNTLVINFPEEGYDIQFQRVGSEPDNQNKQKQPSKGKTNIKTVKKSTNCASIQVLQAEVSGGCNIRLVSPSQCEEIDLSNGKGYEFAWQTGGTFCETPYKFYISGNPYNEQNVISWQFSTKTGQISRTAGGYTYVTAQDLAGLSSVDGVYSWVVYGWYGSHPASQNFRVKM